LIHHHDNTSTEMIEFSSLQRTLRPCPYIFL
jgi:hypothetical protein